jgi:hypothetical protein
MIKNITAFTAKSLTGRAIEGVRIEPERIIATDSYKLIEIIEHTGAGESFIVKLPKGLKSFDRAERTEVGAYLHKGGASYSGTIIQDEYPKWEKIIPEGKPTATVKLNPEMLGEICKAFTEGRAIPEMTIAYYGENKPLVFTRNDGLLRAVLAPMIN